MPVFGTSTVTVSAGLNRGMSFSYNITDPNTTYSASTGNAASQNYASGGGVKKINNGASLNVTLAAAGDMTVNLNTGGCSGSVTTPLLIPGTGGATFSTTGLNLFEIDFSAGGSQSITITPAVNNGFTGFFTNGSQSITLKGSDSTGGGGSCRFECSDSIGWGVSTATCNVRIKNLDGANASTFTLNVGGQ
jgi:hypothetical protein